MSVQRNDKADFVPSDDVDDSDSESGEEHDTKPLHIDEQSSSSSSSSLGCSSDDISLQSSEAGIDTEGPTHHPEATTNPDSSLSQDTSALRLSDDSSSPDTINSSSQSDTTKQACQKEVDHLLQRIKRNRAAFSVSNLALTQAVSYETNVLKATRNCYNEWRSIQAHYNVADSLGLPICTSVGLALYSLLQHALQTGPLAGGKPGQFARCGGGTAEQIGQLLRELLDSTSQWYWTDSQTSRVSQWERKASKAAAQDRDVSKSVQKRLDEVQRKKNKIMKRAANKKKKPRKIKRDDGSDSEDEAESA
jgi:hypothetical protein